MARILVLGFADRAQADEARAVAERLEREDALGLRGAAIGWRDEDGGVHVDLAVSPVGASAGTGAAAGGVLGLFLAAPILGALAGGVAGAAGGTLSALGLTHLHARKVTEALEPGRAALFVLADSGDVGQVAGALRRLHPVVIETTLPEWDERDLVRALGDASVS